MSKRMVILGAAESGVGAAVLARKKGFDVFVSDMGKIKSRYVEMLDRYGIAWEVLFLRRAAGDSSHNGSGAHRRIHPFARKQTELL